MIEMYVILEENMINEHEEVIFQAGVPYEKRAEGIIVNEDAFKMLLEDIDVEYRTVKKETLEEMKKKAKFDNKYYEYNNHEYYALVTAEPYQKCMYYSDVRADELYLAVIGGETEESLAANPPVEISKEVAFWKFVHANRKEDLTINQVIEQFEKASNEVLLVDGALV